MAFIDISYLKNPDKPIFKLYRCEDWAVESEVEELKKDKDIFCIYVNEEMVYFK